MPSQTTDLQEHRRCGGDFRRGSRCSTGKEYPRRRRSSGSRSACEGMLQRNDIVAGSRDIDTRPVSACELGESVVTRLRQCAIAHRGGVARIVRIDRNEVVERRRADVDGTGIENRRGSTRKCEIIQVRLIRGRSGEVRLPRTAARTYRSVREETQPIVCRDADDDILIVHKRANERARKRVFLKITSGKAFAVGTEPKARRNDIRRGNLERRAKEGTDDIAVSRVTLRARNHETVTRARRNAQEIMNEIASLSVRPLEPVWKGSHHGEIEADFTVGHIYF